MTDLQTPPSAPDTPVQTFSTSSPRRATGIGFDPGAHHDTTLPPAIAPLRRVFKDRRLMAYNRLAVLVVALNLLVVVYGLTAGGWFARSGVDLAAMANVTILNLAAAIFIRQQYVINLLFRVATSIPTSWPLRIRWAAGKVYHFGGIHVGGALMGTLWFTAFLGGLVYHYTNGLSGASTAQLLVTSALLVLLGLMIGFSVPSFRASAHDRFERMHRFGGWSALGLFWAQTVIFVADNSGEASLASALVESLGFWLLLAITISIALPWMRLQRVPVDIVRPSDHVALVRFNHGTTPFAGSSTTVSRSPLLEWHSFANVPSPDEEGFRLTISRAGDWTGQLIDDTPSHLWVKGIATAGVGNVDKLFKRVVWVATGSGIGPTLPHLLAQDVPAHLVWATRDPVKTYGQELVDEILAVQPNPTIWDTDAHGKPDMVKLAYQAVRDFDAEAVICISNKKLTWQVVEGMERIGVPAFGAIWDS